MPITFDTDFKVYRMREMISLPSGKKLRIMASGDTKTAARAEFEKKRLRVLNLGDRPSKVGAPASTGGPKTFEAYAEEWLATYPKAAKNRDTTLAEKTYHVRVRLVPYFRRLGELRGTSASPVPITLAEITPKVIDRLIADLGDSAKLAAGPVKERDRELKNPKKLSAQTVRNIMQTFRKMLVSAKRWGEIESLPEIPTVKVPRAKFDFLKFDEVERLFATIGEKGTPEDLALIMTGIKTGLRAGELLGLQWGDVDLVRKELRIEFQLPLGAAVASTKRVQVKAGVRTVPMTDTLVGTFKKIRHLKGEWVFCDTSGGPLTRDDLKRKLEIYLRRASLRRVHPHVMRHTFASHLAIHGIPLIQIKEWLGHSSIQTTMRYAHLAPTDGTSRVNVLDRPFVKETQSNANPATLTKGLPS